MAPALASGKATHPGLVFRVAWWSPSVKHDLALEYQTITGCVVGCMLDVL